MPYILKVISEDRALLESAFCFIFFNACIKSAKKNKTEKDEGDSLKESNVPSLCNLAGSLNTFVFECLYIYLPVQPGQPLCDACSTVCGLELDRGTVS